MNTVKMVFLTAGEPTGKDVRSGEQVILLRETGPGGRILQFWASNSEVEGVGMIAYSQKVGVEPVRPPVQMTMIRVIEKLGGFVTRVVIQGEEGNLFASITFQLRGEIFEAKAEAREAIPLALAAGIEVEIDQGIFEETCFAPAEVQIETGETVMVPVTSPAKLVS